MQGQHRVTDACSFRKPAYPSQPKLIRGFGHFKGPWLNSGTELQINRCPSEREMSEDGER